MQMIRFLQGWRLGELLVILGLGLLTVTLWRVPLFGLLFYPFQLFNTFVHELSHGLAAILTGGEFRRFSVEPDLSGLAWSAGGIRWIITSAGYVGSAIFGAVLVIVAGWGWSARVVLSALGLILGLLCLVFVRNLFGLGAGIVLAALLFFAGRRLSEFWADGLLLLLAVQMMLNALDSVLDVVWLSTYRAGVRTDAQIMQDMTGLPAIFWALVWALISLCILVFALAIAYRRAPAQAPQAGR